MINGHWPRLYSKLKSRKSIVHLFSVQSVRGMLWAWTLWNFYHWFYFILLPILSPFWQHVLSPPLVKSSKRIKHFIPQQRGRLSIQRARPDWNLSHGQIEKKNFEEIHHVKVSNIGKCDFMTRVLWINHWYLVILRHRSSSFVESVTVLRMYLLFKDKSTSAVFLGILMSTHLLLQKLSLLAVAVANLIRSHPLFGVLGILLLKCFTFSRRLFEINKLKPKCDSIPRSPLSCVGWLLMGKLMMSRLRYILLHTSYTPAIL